MSGKIRVLLADDHAIVRKALRGFIEKYPAFEVVAEAQSGSEIIDLVKLYSPDVLILDLEMPERNGIKVLADLAFYELPVKVLILTAHTDRHIISSFLRLGVAGYFSKDDLPSDIVEVIHRISLGEKNVFSKAVSRVMEK